MTAPPITTANEVYGFIAELKTDCEKHGDNGLANELDDALRSRRRRVSCNGFV
jgi:hypothetical protein